MLSNRKTRLILVGLFMLILTTVAITVVAQDIVDGDCAALVIEAVASIDEQCSLVAGNSVCYAHPTVEAEAMAGAELAFSAPGDQASLDDVASLHTSPVNVETGDWGIAVVNTSPAESDSADDETLSENPRLLLMGDVTLQNISADVSTFESAFVVETSGDEPSCAGAPNKFILQSEADALTVEVNGAEIGMDTQTTLLVDAVANDGMTIAVIEGSATVTSNDESIIVNSGEQTVIVLGGDTGLVVISAPAPPILIITDNLQFVPISVLVDVVEVPSLERWTNTETELTAGQSFTIIASELVKTADELPWSSPTGHTPQDCAAAGRGDWDCRCRTLPEWGTCSLTETTSMILLGRIGGEENQPFVVGSGGVFTASTDGTLYLGANDNFFEDNIGSYSALIQVIDFTP